MTDISKQLDFFSSLNLSDLNLGRFLDNLEVGIIIVNEKSLIVHANKSVKRIFGYSKEELIGQELNTLLHQDSAALHQSHIDHFFRKPENRPMGTGLDLYAKKKDDTTVPVEVSISYLKTAQGKLGLAFINDITLRKKMEMELLAANNELQSFAKTVAHDINNTLSGVVGLSELLAKEYERIPKDEQKELLMEVAQSGRKLSNVINELLLFASIDKVEIKLVPVDMKFVINEAILRLHYLTNKDDFEITMPASFPLALGHSAWIEEVWYNLISNAIKYGGNPPHLEFGYQIHGNKVQYWLKDNGTGIPKEQLSIIFNPSELAEHNIIKGHGLGLSIVKRIVEKLDGEVTVDSHEGIGSTFGFLLTSA